MVDGWMVGGGGGLKEVEGSEINILDRPLGRQRHLVGRSVAYEYDTSLSPSRLPSVP